MSDYRKQSVFPKHAKDFSPNTLLTAREYDSESQTYYYRARQYNPYTGRFNRRDPIEYRGGLNLYSYVLNNPIKYTDPLGLGTGIVSPRDNPPDVNKSTLESQKPPTGYDAKLKNCLGCSMEGNVLIELVGIGFNEASGIPYITLQIVKRPTFTPFYKNEHDDPGCCKWLIRWWSCYNDLHEQTTTVATTAYTFEQPFQYIADNPQPVDIETMRGSWWCSNVRGTWYCLNNQPESNYFVFLPKLDDNSGKWTWKLVYSGSSEGRGLSDWKPYK